MSREQNISWGVPSGDLSVSPLGYSVELGENALVSPVSVRHSTFENTEEFEVSMEGDGVFQVYPPQGITGATTATVVRMLRRGETATSVMMVGNGSFLYKMSLSCKQIMLYKQICETDSYSIDSVSCDSTGKIWVKDTGGVMTVLDRQLRTLNTFRLSPYSIFAAVDPFRRLLWQVSGSDVTLTRLSDMSVIMTAALPSMATSVTGWDLSGPSGTLFLVLDASRAVAIAIQGSIVSFSTGATGVCQWGPVGALACVPDAGRVDIFDGTSVTSNLLGSAIGVDNPTRIASIGRGYTVVTDASGLVVKADEDWLPKWSITAPPLWTNIDVRITPGPTEMGRVVYLVSTVGVASYRDMLTDGWAYGSLDIALEAGRAPCLYPVAAVVPELSHSHAWARIEAISSDDVEPRGG